MTTLDAHQLVISVDEAARILGIGRGTAYRAAREGTLPGLVTRLGGRYVISRARLLASLSPSSGEMEPERAAAASDQMASGLEP